MHETARLLGLDPVSSLAPIRDGLAWRWARQAASDITDKDIVPIVDEARERAVPGLTARRAAPSSARARARFRRSARCSTGLSKSAGSRRTHAPAWRGHPHRARASAC